MRMWSSWNLMHPWWEWFSHLKNNLAISLIKLTIQLPASRNLPLKNKNLCAHKNPYMKVYSCFSHIQPNLETIQMSFNCWMEKLLYIHVKEYCSASRRNEPHMNNSTKWNKLHSRAMFYMSLFIWQSGNGKVIKIENNQGLPRAVNGERIDYKETAWGNFEDMMELLYISIAVGVT